MPFIFRESARGWAVPRKPNRTKKENIINCLITTKKRNPAIYHGFYKKDERILVPLVYLLVMRTVFILLTLGLFLAGCSSDEALPTVKKVSLEKYAGTWYEIASFPTRFQEGCSCTTASYEQKDGYVAVYNKCYKAEEEEWEEATGKAFPVEGTNNSKLKVQFFWPFKGDYFIIALDEDYQYAMVGAPSREYLWILSRSPEMETSVQQSLMQKAESLGFDTEQLQFTKHDCDAL